MQEVHTLALEDLATPACGRLLKWAFSEPDVNELKPGKTREALTKEAAQEFVTLAQSLRERGHDPEQVAHFVNRLVFCMFAEDVGLLPDKLFKRMLEASVDEPDELRRRTRSCCSPRCAEGGDVGFRRIDWFNGGLFDDDARAAADQGRHQDGAGGRQPNWSNIDPSIFGTLFERGLDPGKRSQLGAHYTDPDKIMLIVNPVIVEPLTREWEEKRAEIEAQDSRAVAHARRQGRAHARRANEASALQDRVHGAAEASACSTRPAAPATSSTWR